MTLLPNTQTFLTAFSPLNRKRNLIMKPWKSSFKEFIAQSPTKPGPEALLKQQENTCKTFLVAISNDAALRIRSYDANTADPFSGIWEAARAIFQPIAIDGIKYGYGTGWNNPTAEAIAEAQNIWPNRPIGCLLSLGTGLIQLSEGNEEGSWLQKLLPHVSRQREVAKHCVTSLTGCEKVHRDVSGKYPDRVISGRNYFRLNVSQGMSNIGLEEWKKIGDIPALTEDYMDLRG